MENLRKLIVNTYPRNPKASYSEIGRITGKCPSTVRRVILRFKELKTVVRKPGCGRKPGAVDKRMEKRVLALFQNQPCLSVKDVGKKLGISKSLVQRIKENNGLITYKAQAAPHRTDKQRQSAKTRSRNLSDRVLKGFQGCILMDDETVVKGEFTQLPGQQFYTAKTRTGVASKYRFKEYDKFPKKYVVWMAICSCGRRSEEFFMTGTMNANIYLKECLQKGLLPLYQSHDIPPLL
ncbi:uncharacterized protein LOC129798830 [Phlebotomus papatasi]|uniref:uncharacterized protein LOC129798830 n=1 Tax=Phlebotomus papatasi TaxID=29031 RepID=UPI0024835283|nr:uncharacterized protein LOC129798830 [Phlebotomus papatasi]